LIFHAEPFHLSARALVTPAPSVLLPTAVQESDAHETADSELALAPLGVGVGSIVQAEPFHLSASAVVTPALFVLLPTPVHEDGDAHDTLARELFCAPLGFGVAWTDQLAALAAPGMAENSAPVRTSIETPTSVMRRTLPARRRWRTITEGFCGAEYTAPPSGQPARGVATGMVVNKCLILQDKQARRGKRRIRGNATCRPQGAVTLSGTWARFIRSPWASFVRSFNARLPESAGAHLRADVNRWRHARIALTRASTVRWG
jgi:hypothetical protein